jgi:hypothetical protein
MFSVFLGHDEHLQVLECSVSVWSVNSTEAVMFFWQQMSRPSETRFNLTRCGRSNNIEFFLFCCWCWRAEGSFWFSLKFEIRYSGRELSVAHSFTVAPLIFRNSVVAMPTFSITHEVWFFMWQFLYAVAMFFFFPPTPIFWAAGPVYVTLMFWHFIPPKFTYSLVKVPQVIIIIILITIVTVTN